MISEKFKNIETLSKRQLEIIEVENKLVDTIIRINKKLNDSTDK